MMVGLHCRSIMGMYVAEHPYNFRFRKIPSEFIIIPQHTSATGNPKI
jgi:hypothetical protein